MANVSGGSPTNRVKVSNTKAEYHSKLTEEYMNKTKEYAEICMINSERSQTQYEEITAILQDLPVQKDIMLEEINSVGSDKIEDIIEAVDPYIAECKDWANKTGDTVDGSEYSAKHYAELVANTHTQALTDITNDLAGAKSEIETTRATAVTSVKSAETTGIANVNTAKTTAINDITTKKNEATTSLQNKYNSCVASMDDQADALIKSCDKLDWGVDLSVKFANEILLHNNIYEWFDNRSNTGNFEGIHVGDYFNVPVKAGTVNGVEISACNVRCRIVGINTYKNCGDTITGNRIYFDSDHVFGPFLWNPEANNNGTSNNPNPFKASAAYAVLNGVNNLDTTSGYNKVKHGANCENAGILQLLPTELVAVMKTKRNILDKRYSSSGLLTNSTDWGWDDEPKLTLRSEIEIYGCQIRSNTSQTTGWWNPEAGLSIQFPWYANNCERRIKYKAGSETARCYWWLSSAASNTSTHVCYVNGGGYANSYSAASTNVYLPLCFCI